MGPRSRYPRPIQAGNRNVSPQKILDINQRLIIIFIPCPNEMKVFPLQTPLQPFYFKVGVGSWKESKWNKCWFGIWEGSVHGSVNFSCPRFFLLLNMNAVMVVRHCGDFLSLKVAEGFVDWFSCWTCALNNSHVPLLVIFAIHHLLIHLFKRSKDKERVHYVIISGGHRLFFLI